MRRGPVVIGWQQRRMRQPFGHFATANKWNLNSATLSTVRYFATARKIPGSSKERTLHTA